MCATKHTLKCYQCGDQPEGGPGPCKDQNVKGNLTTCEVKDDYVSCVLETIIKDGVVTYMKGCLEGLPASGCLDVSENEEGITRLCVCDTDECNDSFDALNR